MRFSATRSIPTRVGTTRSTPPCSGTPTVHPHACGDYWVVVSPKVYAAGPSPRVWGLQQVGNPHSHIQGSIPTRVGTTAYGAYYVIDPEVHPHACGDYSWARRPPGMSSGPSPRVWGLRYREAHKDYALRSIPTRVGTTVAMPSWRRTHSVHPHACGDYFGRPARMVSPTVHPHACGDYLMEDLTAAAAQGPSPRVWGLHLGHDFFQRTVGSIPTRVGTTV